MLISTKQAARRQPWCVRAHTAIQVYFEKCRPIVFGKSFAFWDAEHITKRFHCFALGVWRCVCHLFERARKKASIFMLSATMAWGPSEKCSNSWRDTEYNHPMQAIFPVICTTWNVTHMGENIILPVSLRCCRFYLSQWSRRVFAASSSPYLDGERCKRYSSIQNGAWNTQINQKLSLWEFHRKSWELNQPS